MQLKNTTVGYGLVAISLHWLMAIILIGLFALGKYMVDLDYYDPWYHRAPWWHKSFGMLVLGLWILRLGWRLYNSPPQPPAIQPAWQAVIAVAVHRLFYLLIVIVVASGYLLSTGEAQGVDVFDWFAVPALIAAGEEQTEFFADVHELATTALAVLLTVHVLAVVRHSLHDRGRTILRILKPGTSGSTK